MNLGEYSVGSGRAESLELGWWDVAERFVEACVVEPAEVLDDRQFELRARLPDAVGDELGLDRVDEALGQRVVVGVTDRPDRREHAVIGQRLGGVDAGEPAGAIGAVHERASAPGRRCPRAIRSASRTSVVRMWPASCQPMTLRDQASTTNAKNTSPSQQRR